MVVFFVDCESGSGALLGARDDSGACFGFLLFKRGSGAGFGGVWDWFGAGLSDLVCCCVLVVAECRAGLSVQRRLEEQVEPRFGWRFSVVGRETGFCPILMFDGCDLATDFWVLVLCMVCV